MLTRAKTFQIAVVSLVALLPACAAAEGFDTEHIFGFMIGADVGSLGEREFQTDTTGRFGRNGSTYRAIGQEFELEFVPARNFRVEIGSTFAWHHISGVPGLEDQRRLSWQGASIDLRYRFLDRETAPFGLTFATEFHGHRVDETTAEAVRSFGTEFRLAFDRELVADRIIAAFNLFYEPEWTRVVGTGVTGFHRRRRARHPGPGAPRIPPGRGGALPAEVRRNRPGGTGRAGTVYRPHGVFPALQTLAAHREL
jgi:hypothetical protein